MDSFLIKTQFDLQAQLSSLADDIRKAESNLAIAKEGYLKVQGALEILDIIKKEYADSCVNSSDLINN
jgi:hypothetical protein